MRLVTSQVREPTVAMARNRARGCASVRLEASMKQSKRETKSEKKSGLKIRSQVRAGGTAGDDWETPLV